MRSFNQCIFMGYVGKDPEISVVGSTKKASFSLATSSSYKDKEGNKVDVTEWHSIVVWGKLASIVEDYVKKGSSLHLTASHKTEVWEKEGVKNYKSIFLASRIDLLDAKLEKAEAEKVDEANASASSTDDLPF